MRNGVRRNAMNITKSAPLPERPCEQLTYCAKNESVQWDYINRVAKRHNCRITGKTKATRYGGPSTQATRYPQRISADYYAVITSGWQCDQCAGLLVGYSCSLVSPCCDVFQACDPIFVRLYSLRNFSRTNAHGANLSCSCSLTAFLRCFFLDEDNFFNDLSVIVDTCNPVRHSSPHHGAGDGYSCSLALRRWRYSTSRFNAAVTNCPVLSPGIFTASTLFITSCGTLAATVCDFAFTAFVAMLCTPYKKQMQYAGKKISVQHLTCLTPGLKLVFNTLLMQGAETTTPRSGGTHAGRLTTNDSKSIEVAMRNHTTHPQGRDSHNLNKYIWRFIALSTAQPRVITIEATSEQEARQQSPAGCVMVFAARIRQGVRHVQ
ncbi:TPA: host cell division inhibitor Icd-like protein [Escherichia coli]|nr:host cell division inhibitor Icd-like protein [Escherichia coli]EIR2666720.1 host cell division inhibitor Icd-like protein [Escherichia coli]EIY1771631.1 host cell division inhibitor Icd-like protein [Escherichia coli]EKK0694176.1 host cell division inhibitor Icd-like protein [Escherichia coli]HBD3536923.1 host cell division inhibitor Icd-like protein [Escherichia coli]